MENFVVSARKYRPQTFDTVIGQEHITTTLKNAIKNNQLAHAFLFCGPRGVGKTTCARILAKTINCENRTADGEACNVCNSCRSFNEGASLNIHELDAASNNSVEDIRTLVEQVRFAPQAGKYKVYIVDEVHMLSSSAFNAFLKTLEEPPPYAIFILATTEKHKILPTILSRCQIFDFKRITNKDSVEHLQKITQEEHIDAEISALQVISEKSEGCMRDALSILDKIVSFTNGELTYKNTLEHLNILDHDYYFKLIQSLLQQDITEAMLIYDEINKKGFDGDMFLNGFAEFLRNLMVSKDDKALILLDVVETIKEVYKKTAKEVSLPYLISALNILNEAEIQYRAARNKRLHVEITLVKLNYLQQAIELAVSDEGLVVKKKIDNPAIAIKHLPLPEIVNDLQPQKHASAKEKRSARLFIEKDAEKNQVPTPAPKKKSQSKDQELVVEALPQTEPPILPISDKKKPISKTSLLETLRMKYQDDYQIEIVAEALILEEEKLQEVWQEFIAGMSKIAEVSISTITAFKSATLEIINENEFLIHVPSAITGGLIEKRRTFLAEAVREAFANNSIHFSTNVQHTIDPSADIPLSKEEQLQNIMRANPLVEKFIDKLKLYY